MNPSKHPAAAAALVLAMLTFDAGSRAMAQGETLYGLHGEAYFGSLLLVDRATGATTEIGELGVSEPIGLDCAPDGTLWGSLGAIGGGAIVTVDRTTGAATEIGASGFAEVPALAIAPDGTIYASVSTGIGDTGDALATIDPATGTGTLVGGGSFGPAIVGMIALAVSPTGILYGVTNQVFTGPALYTIDPATGLATFAAEIEEDPGVPLSAGVLGLAFAADGTLLATTEFSTGYFASPRSGTSGGDLLRIDPATGAVLELVGSSDVVVSALGFCRGTGGPIVFAILPDRAGNKGSVDAILYHGLSLAAGASVELTRSGEPPIVGNPVLVDPTLHRIRTTFDLTGHTPGPRDVVVTDATDPSNAGILAGGFTVEDGSIALLGITPATGGEGGSVTAAIQGRHVMEGAAVKLVRGGEEIPGSPVLIGLGNPLFAGPATIAAIFDLRGRALGAWDVVVTNPGDPASPGILPGGFTIAGSGPARISFDVAGPDGVRVGRPTHYVITLRNEGNVDTTAAVALFGIPEDALWQVDMPHSLFSAFQKAALEEETPEGPAIILPAILLPAGVQRTAGLTLEASSDGDFEIRAVLVQDR